MHFGATLRLLRLGAGVGLRALADQVGVSGAYLSRVEHGHDPPPTTDRLIEVARVLGVPPELLLELADRVSPTVARYTDEVPEASRLAFEIARRRLGPAQIGRVLAFVEEQFPLAGSANRRVVDLLAPGRVLLGVRVGSLDDLLELAALRCAEGGRVAEIAAALRKQQATGGSAVGQGLLVPNCAGTDESPRAMLATLATPLDVPTPDGRPIRAMIAFAGLGAGREGLPLLASAAGLARPARIDALCRASSPAEALEVVAGLP
jgi:PTS system nitrogen regulatory IIA component